MDRQLMTFFALVVFSLSIVVQGLAVYLALRTMVSSRVRWAWGSIAIALALILPRRVITTFTVFQQPAPAKFLPSELLSLALSVFFCLGLVRLRRYFRQSEADAELRRLGTQEMGTEAKLRAVIEQQDNAQTSQQNEKSLWRFFDSIDDFLFVLDEQRRILRVNRAVTERLGYSEEELTGRLVLTVFPRERWSEAETLMSDLISGRVEYSPVPIEAKDGTLIPVETRVVRGNWNSHPVFFGVCKDIFGLKLSEEKFSKAFHGSPALMALIKAGNRTVFDVNEAFLRVLGYSRDEAIGKTPTELNLFVDLGQRDRLLEGLQQGRQTRNVEMQLRTRAGEIRDGLVSVEMLSLARESLILAVVVDITERKRVEEAFRLTAEELACKNRELAVARDAALEADRAKSQFLANMSHEIRTPLGGMLGLAELLSRSPLDSDQQEYVDSITRCGDLLLGILNDILDFSKIEAGRLQLESIPFDLASLVFDVVELHGTKAASAAVEFVADLDVDLPSRLLGDPGRLRQVLGNLVSNAVKFTSRGHILIEVRQVKRDGDKAVISIVVRDTGEGIPEQVIGRLFQPFVQADASTSRKHGGTGLGLALSKRIVEGMGGSIELHSQEGQGSTVTIVLDLAVDSNEPIRPSHSAILQGCRCLVVDDNALVRTSLEKQLRHLGMAVQLTGSGDEALQAIELALENARPYDLAIVDLLMPDMGGERLARTMKDDSRLAALGIVMMAPLASRGSVSDVSLPRAFNCDGYLAKPARGEVLAKVLALVVERRREGIVGEPVTRHTVSVAKAHASSRGRLPFSIRVLLAEDNEVNQLVARKMLEDLGAEVTLAVDGCQVLSAIEQRSFDVVLMDCQMPRMDGFATTIRIRALEQQSGGHLPIVAMTANAIAGDEEMCLAAGMDGYLGKPFSRAGLHATLIRFAGADASRLALFAPETVVPKQTNPPMAPDLDHARFREMDALFSNSAGGNYASLLLSFQSNSEKRIQELRLAVECNDASTVLAVAHAIKGSSGNLGFAGLQRMAGQLEHAAKASRIDIVSAQVAAMQEELARIATFLESYFAKASRDT
jgi:PAS domain S-box-containing protein